MLSGRSAHMGRKVAKDTMKPVRTTTIALNDSYVAPLANQVSRVLGKVRALYRPDFLGE